ncbi:hypothetical protein [Sphingopyxis kveilinensis]|uniref:hypothetical protein n=1 Tax=Sphingopyxis kveilinensis TaxID=3114367 RepID=UPI0030D35405
MQWQCPAIASETISYTYDAKGRLVKVVRSGSVNSGVTTDYEHDPADNRSRVKVTNSSNPTPTPTPTPAGCTFTAAPDFTGGSDEFSVYPYIMRNNECAAPVTLSYTIMRVSGSGQYSIYDAPFGGTGPFLPGNSSDLYRAVQVSPWASTIDPGDNLVLNISWTVTSMNASITDADILIRFCYNGAGC